MQLSSNALTVLKKRYLAPSPTDPNALETPDQMWDRVAQTLADVDKNYGKDDSFIAASFNDFRKIMADLDFLPNSPTLANAGARTGMLSACFVLPIEDCLSNADTMAKPGMGSGIFDTIRAQAVIHQGGGGTGFSFSKLRPKHREGTAIGLVKSTHGGASGPISFMDVYNAATDSIKQGGMRRGANMGILRIDHPDIMAFIKHKEDLSKLTNFNISVAITDDFMWAVENKTNYALIDPSTGRIVEMADAVTVFQEIVQRAWSTGEPGIVFIDRMNDYCPVPWLGKYEATNPCGEQPLLPYESCNLGSINLENFVVEEPDGKTRIDWIRLGHVIPTITHMMDNVIDANKYPIPEIEEVSLATRKLGIGVMGFARMLFKLGVGYGSPESLTIASQIFSFIDYGTKLASVRLARWKGSFPARLGHENESTKFFDRICYERAAQTGVHPACDYIYLAEEIAQYGIRNSNTTTEAPTGTLSIIADTSGGCEPVFALAFKRFQADEHMIDSDAVFRDYIRSIGYPEDYVSDIMADIDANHGSLDGFQATWGMEARHPLPDVAFKVFVTAHDITPEEHVNVQAAFQRFNDSAVSKTINFAESATVEDVEKAYLLAYKLGCKGITVYRNNSRKFQPLSVSEAPAAVELAVTVPQAPAPKEKVCPTCGACNPCGEECLCDKPAEPKTLFEVVNGEPPFATMTNIGQADFEDLERSGKPE